MSLELFNISDNIRTIPRYKYNGKVSLNPGQTYPIEEFMVGFFTPYSKVGVVIRRSDGAGKIEPVEKIKNDPKETFEDALKKESDKQKKDNTDKREDKAESGVKDASDNGEAKESKEDHKKYTAGELLTKSLNELKDIAGSLGIDVSEMKRKAQVSDAILDSQK